ncbi:PQQ-binding-like beta-propeller repeat protein [Streptomyces triculaminicus]|uniref:outer membrane protein assembly factor BamB family protein n=1 Tax=Streptomyces triculaminicus TaxID=2816232 RepID=UPI0033DFF4E2
MSQPPPHGHPPRPGDRSQQPSAPLPPLAPPTLPSPVISVPDPAPAPARRPVWRKPAVLGLVLALVLGAGGWALWSFLGDGGQGHKKPAAAAKDAAGTVAWKAGARTKPDDKGMKEAPGTWFTSSLVVKAEPDMVTAYDVRTGEKKWSFLLTGPLCAASRESEDNVAVVAVRIGGACARMLAVDLRDGHRIWDELIVDDKDAAEALIPEKWKNARLEIALHDGHAYAIWGTGGQTRRLKDGKRVEDEKWDACEMVDTAGGDLLIAITYCGDKGTTIRSLDPEKLDKPRWSRKIEEKQDGILSVVSTSPLVITQSPGKAGPDARYDFVVLDPANGNDRTRVPYNSYWRLGFCFLPTAGCTGAVVDKNSLYVAGKGVTMAYDLATGKERWTYKADAGRVTLPVSVRDGEVAAYTPATAERRGRVTYVSAASGKALRTVEHSDREADRKNEAMMAKVQGYPRLRNDRLLLIDDGEYEDAGSGMIFAINAPSAD